MLKQEPMDVPLFGGDSDNEDARDSKGIAFGLALIPKSDPDAQTQLLSPRARKPFDSLGNSAVSESKPKIEEEDASDCPSDNEAIDLQEPAPIPGYQFTYTRQADGSTMLQRSTGRGKVGAIFPSMRSQPPKVKPKPPRKLTLIPELDPPSEGDRIPNYSCWIRGPYITFRRTDSKTPPNRIGHPSLEPPSVLPNGEVNFYYLLPRQSSQVLWWKTKIGTKLAKLMGFQDALTGARQYFITEFPENYVLYQHRKGPKADPRTDCYLESSGRVPRFRSPEEFYDHAFWLILRRKEGEGRLPCKCIYCTRKRETLKKRYAAQTLHVDEN